MLCWMLRVAHSSGSSRCGDPFVLIIHCADARALHREDIRRHLLDVLDAAEYPHGVLTVGPEQAAHREESHRGIERAWDPQTS